MKARVYMTLRKDVLDPQGEAVRRGLGSLGYDEVSSVRIGNKRKRCQEKVSVHAKRCQCMHLCIYVLDG